jgi:hypothetical protein
LLLHKRLLQTKEEKRATREQNPASGRRIEGDGGKKKDGGDVGADHVISKKLVINPGSKKDKYAGMSRAKRRRYATPRAHDFVDSLICMFLYDACVSKMCVCE